MADGKVTIDTELNDKGLEKGLKGLQGKLEGTGKKLQSLGGSLTKSLTLPIVAAGTGALLMAAKFDDSMRLVKATMGNNLGSSTKEANANFKLLREEAMKLGATTAHSASDASGAMKELAQMGYDTNQVLASTGTVLDVASASGLDLDFVATTLAGSMNQFGVEVDDNGVNIKRFGDVMVRAGQMSGTSMEEIALALEYVGSDAHTAGMSIEQTAAYLGVLGDQSIKGGKAGTALSSVLRDMKAKVKDGNLEFDEFNVAMYDSQGNMRDMTDIMGDLEKGLEGKTDAERDAAIGAVFGSQAQKAVNAILGEGTGKLKKYEAELKLANDTAKIAAGEMEGGIGGALRCLASATEALAITFGDVLAPMVRKVAEFVANLFLKFIDLTEGQKKVVVGVLAVLAAIGPLLTIIGTLIIFVSKLIGAFSSFGFIIPIFTAIKAAVIGFVTAVGIIPIAIGAAVIAAVALIYMYWEPISEFFINLWETIKEVFMSIWEPIQALWGEMVSYLSELWEPVGEIFTALWESIKAVFLAVWEPIKEAWNEVVQTFTQLWQGIAEFFTELWGTIQEIFMSVWEPIKEAWNEVISFIKELWQPISEFFREMWTEITEIFSIAWELITTIFQAAWALIQPVVETGMGIISTIISSVFEVIKTVISTAWNVIKTVFTSVLNVIKPLVMSAFEVMKAVISSVMNVISSVISTVWNVIKTVITTVLDVIMTVVRAAFDVIKTVIQTVLSVVKAIVSGDFEQMKGIISTVTNAIKSIISTVWNAIKSVITSVLNGIKSIVSSVWNGIKSTISSVMSGIRSIISSVWNAIKSVVTGAVNGIRSVVTSVFNAIRSVISSVMSAIRSVISSVWNGIRSTISSVTNSIRSTISSVFNALGGIVTGAMGKVKSAVTNGIKGALTAVTSMGSKFKEAGSKIVSMIADGIKAAASKVTGAAKDLMGKVRDFLPFSPAKTGPLTDIDKLNFGGPIEQSLDDAIPDVQAKMNTVLDVPALNPEMDRTPKARQQRQDNHNSNLVRAINKLASRPASFEIEGEQVVKAISGDLDDNLSNKLNLEAYLRGDR